MAYHAAAGPQLAGVVDSVPAMPLAMMLHAIPGWGKTSWAAQIPNTIFLMVGNERGFLTLLGRGLIPKTKHFPHPAQTANEVRLAIHELLIGDHNYKNLTIDVFNEVQRLYFQEAIDRDYGGNAGKFLDFGGTKGPEEVAQKDMPDLLGRLDELRYKRGMSITLLSHTATPKHTNPTTGDTFNYYAPALAKPITENIGRWADAVLFGQHEIYVTPGGKGKKTYAVGGEHRIIQTENNAAWIAKNRLGLSGTIDGGSCAEECWKNFLGAIKLAKEAREAPIVVPGEVAA